MRSLTYYVAASVDGYIAGPDGQFDFFGFEGDFAAWIMQEYPETLPVHAREVLGINDRENQHFDVVAMGRRTYQPALDAGIASPYPHLRQIVFTKSLTSHPADVELVGGSATALIRNLKKEDGRGIWLAGGGHLAAELWDEIDELIIKRSPIVLGSGVPLLDGSFAPRVVERVDSQSFDTGVVVETYRSGG